MNGIGRVYAAINRLPSDRFPRGELVVDKQFIKEFMKKETKRDNYPEPVEEDLEMEIEFYHRLGLDLVCVHDTEPMHHSGDLCFKLDYIRRFNAEGFFVFLVLNGVFQTLVNQAGFTNFMKNIARWPQQVGEELQKLSQKISEHIRKGLPDGVHGIIIADDIAFNRGTYVAPEFIQKYLLPCWQNQVNSAREQRIPVFLHSDGNINAVLPIIVEAGFDGLQCIEPAAGMNFKEVKQKYGKYLCLMGNIDPALLYGNGANNSFGCASDDPHVQKHNFPELARAVNELIAMAAPDGGFIFGTCSGLHAGLSTEKVKFMYELVRNI
ncbi:uroporphyrinogen decarboxylase family protein [Desulfoscipio geothermicus]|uniref:Uroporphyrinogen decarboxylase n=1 Tax=Desulfoscipio geothermicus DSM 3669 TaxID=1121426 RepID=A0A1I6EIN9_9FIRM|nr:uroporphyrinogen decarboxylase family protein [Desulfoscipio geothermicus]SFR17623.1 uroporphyrinogen decarboxylase [Desulfoscipio geothermicus DSM 3669]